MDFKFAFAVSIILFSQAAGADILINEVMYAPNNEWGGQYNEWIELYNNGTGDADITNWTIDGKTIPEASVPAGGYLVIAKNSTRFGEYYGLPSVQVPFTLSNDGEVLNLGADGIAADILDYAPYAAENLAKNNNLSLERAGSMWLESPTAGGTPGNPNSATVPEETPPENSTQQENPPENNPAPEPQLQEPPDSNAPRIEIIRAPQSMRFGDLASVVARFYPESRNFSKVRFVAYVFSPSWIARDISREDITLRNSPYNSAAAVEIPGIAGGTTENVAIPLFLKCKGGYSEGSYSVRVRAYTDDGGSWSDVAGQDAQISVSGENGMCAAEKCENKTVYVNRTTTVKEKCPAGTEATGSKNAESGETLEINITAPEIVFAGNNFTTIAVLKNNGNSTLDLEAYSYLYEHSTVMSQGWTGEKWGNARTANSKKATLAPGEEATLELVNMPRENIALEKYTFKVRIDDLNYVKKSEERVFLVEVRAQEKNESVTVRLENNTAENPEKITGMATVKFSGSPKTSFWTRIINRIKSWLD